MTRNDDLTALLDKHDKGEISLQEREQLHSLLKKIYNPGEKMMLYKCPECKKPLMYFFDGSVQCLFVYGCGKIVSNGLAGI